MLIGDLRTEWMEGCKRVAATVTWEDVDRGDETIWFAVGEADGEALSANPHAFLVASAVPALHFGERRLSMREPVCPDLVDGLTTATELIRLWHYGHRRRPLNFEVATDPWGVERPPERHAAFFFSGGLDSYASLCANHDRYPSGHPRAIRDGIVAYGLEMDDPERFEWVLEHLRGAARSIDVELFAVYTNIYLRFRGEDARSQFRLWRYEYQGAALAAIAHSLAGRIQSVAISASDNIHALEHMGTHSFRPLGSHPLLDPAYGSADLRIHYDGLAASRLDKARAIVDCDNALANLRVCNKFDRYRSGQLNCGRCEKCVRTMLELLAAGALERTGAFGRRDVPAALVEEAVRIPPRMHEDYTVIADYAELCAPLEAAGRPELARILRRKVAQAGRGGTVRSRLKARVRRWDSRLLGGTLAGWHAAVRGRFRRGSSKTTSM